MDPNEEKENMEEQDPSITDIKEMIARYIACNKGKVAFIGHFISFDGKGVCDSCSEEKGDLIDPKKCTIMAYGDLETLREMSNDLRSLIEDNVDKKGFVSY